MLIGQCVPVAGIILTAFLPNFIIENIITGVSSMFNTVIFRPVYDVTDSLSIIPIICGIIILVVSGLFKWKSGLLKKRSATVSSVWGCGFTNPTSKMQYTGESFSENIDLLNIRKTVRKKDLEIPKNEIFAKPHKIEIFHKDKLDNAVSGNWIKYTRKITRSLAFIQTGKIDKYILQGLLFIVIILLLTFTGVV